MAKYDPLRDHLAARPWGQHHITMTFTEVEVIVGTLPPSARNHREWWANDSKVEAKAWRAAGWHVASCNLTRETVEFERGVIGGTYAASHQAEVDKAQVKPIHSQLRETDNDAMTEATVQSYLVAHLVSEGWQIQRVADTASKERGIDVLASRDGDTLAVEVKGYPSRAYADPSRADEVKPTAAGTQARHWYAQAILKALLTRNDHPDYKVALAFPAIRTYLGLYDRTRSSLHRTGVTVLFIDRNGDVT